MKYLLILLVLLTFGSANSQTQREIYDYIVECEIKHPDIVMKQVLYETAHLKSYLFRVQHNLFSMKLAAKRETLATGTGKNNDYACFRTWKESIEDYKIYQSEYYDGEKDYYQFLQDTGYFEDPKYITTLKGVKIRL
jgi:hypothetical protein